ncbi:MAG TPA: SpoIIE family protein phosphatase, partial [Candidatus Ozemobacteraceae bacterium]|nr:SpoIIE family protein phosphatase [Candidatus Ozemobacteraceae bacterium]
NSSRHLFTASLLRLLLLAGLLVIPGLMVFFGMTAREERMLEQMRRRLLHEATSRLDRYVHLGDRGIYLAQLLRETFDRADGGPNPVDELSRRLNRVKRSFPEALTTIAWNASGSLIPACTDIQGFRTILAKTHDILRETALHIREIPARELPMLPGIAPSLSLIGGFFGRFFVPSQLAWAYGIESGYPLALAEVGTRRSYYWHRSGKHLSLLVFLNEAVVQNHRGFEKTIAAVNRRSPHTWQLTIVDPRSPHLLTASAPSGHLCELLTTVQKETHAGGQLHETQNLIVGTRRLPDGRILLAWIPRTHKLPHLPRRIRQLMVNIALGYILLFLVWKCSVWRRWIAPSIQYELVLLFLMASGVPLGTLIINSSEFLETWRDSTVRHLQEEAERRFKQADDRVTPFVNQFAERLGADLPHISPASNASFTPQEVFSRLASSPTISSANELYLFAEGGINLTACPGRLVSPARKNSMTEIGKAVRSMLIYGSLPSSGRGKGEGITDTRQFLNAVGLLMLKVGGLRRLEIGSRKEWLYVNEIRAGPQPRDWMLLVGVWSDQSIAEMFLHRTLSDLRQLLPEIRVEAHPGKEMGTWLTSRIHEHWAETLNLARQRGRVLFQNVAREGRFWYGLAYASRVVPDLVYLATISESQISNAQQQLLKWGTAAGLVLFAFALLIGGGLARSFLKPLERIENTAIALQNRQFTCPPVSGSLDEFGELERTFAEVTGSLSELEIARVVQESLLPDDQLSFGPFKVYGRSCAVTALGGDYFDFFVHKDSKICVLLGDVAGHGVGAALMMAIAKAAVFLGRASWDKPSAVLQLVHEQFFALQKKPKKLMTMLFVTLDVGTGAGWIANAGQTYPILLRQ